MFHLRYSRARDFLTWDELGCLSRSLGFQVDLFRANVTDEITYDDRGLHIQEVYRMLEYKLLHKSLHLTFNIHTDTWNVAALKKAVSLVEHKAFTFEQLHCIRVAYQLYEHQDSKGMVLQQRVILRALKMCGRTIAPLKLMHRLKHMKGYFVEGGRIQLDEFLDLILWCDMYEEFQSDELIYSRGMDKDLFKLVAFERMLTHHDQRLSERLNSKYLAEEWDFGQESLGSKRMFKEPPVNDKIRVQQVQKQRTAFRPLKTEVDRSQHKVYRSRVGFVRPRPLSALDLTSYRQTTSSSKKSADGTMTLSAYEIMQRMRRKPPSSAEASKRRHTEPFCPVSTERKQIPVVVTAKDVADAANKLHDVMFQMETLEVRYEYETERDLRFLLPRYTSRPHRVQETHTEIKTNSPKPVKRKSSKTSPEDRIDQLVHPRPQTSLSHAKTCDARHRGWHAANTSAGRHYILSSPTHQRSPHAQLHQRLFEKSSQEIRHLHGNFLYRRTPSQQGGIGRGRRPSTAPSTTTCEGHSAQKSHSDSEESQRAGDDAYSVQAEGTIKGSTVVQPLIPETTKHSRTDAENCKIASQETLTGNERPCGCADELVRASSDERVSLLAVEEEKQGGRQDAKVLPSPSAGVVTEHDEPTVTEIPSSKAVSEEGNCVSPPSFPVPYMEHSKPAVVEVGQIGKISLLEDIAESRLYESVADGLAIKKDKIGYGTSESSAHDSGRGDSEGAENEILGSDLDTGLKMSASQESPNRILANVEAEEEQKLRAIAMLRIYTHRLATPHRKSKRRKQGSPGVAGERRSVSASCSRPSGANRCGRAGESGEHRRVTKSAPDETRKMISV